MLPDLLTHVIERLCYARRCDENDGRNKKAVEEGECEDKKLPRNVFISRGTYKSQADLSTSR